MKNPIVRLLVLALGAATAATSASALTIHFHVDTQDSLHFEMANLGPTPGDQDLLSPSGTWGIYAFVHQFEAPDEFAEIGLFVKKLLPVSEVIGTDVIFPQVYGLPDFPLLEFGLGEFGDMYTATFALKSGSGDNAQEWDWTMTLTAGDPGNGGAPVPDTSSTLLMLGSALAAAGWLNRGRSRAQRIGN